MSAIVPHRGLRVQTMRAVPAPGEAGSVSHCPLCRGAAPPCLACRDELRARLADMQLAWYVERAVN